MKSRLGGRAGLSKQERGDPLGDIPPGTAWDEIPDDWRCPECGAAKSDFDMVEI